MKFDESAALGTQEFDDMVDKGNWSGIMKTTEDDVNGSAGFGDVGPASPSRRSERSRSRSGRSPGPGTPHSNRSGSSDDTQKRQYMERVRELVGLVVPDEVDNVPAMMEQFAGREEELINTLQTMYERSSSSRARKAVHRSKGIPDESGRFQAGSADGTAAVAAASTIGSAYDSQSGSGAFGTDQGSYAQDSYAQDSYAQGSYTEGQDDPYADDYDSRGYDDDYGDD